MKHPIGVIHGRFQPLHLGHMEYLLAGAERCRELVVGITNPDPTTCRAETTDPGRGLLMSNPCTYYERSVILEAALVANGIARERLRFVPFPHSFPERLRYYAPRDATYFLTIYDDWGRTKLDRFRELGFRTEVLWERDWKFTSGTEVRERIRNRLPWESLVPPSTAYWIRSFGIDERIRVDDRESGDLRILTDPR